MLRSGKYIIYTRNGKITLPINKNIILNSPNKICSPDSIISKYSWFSETYENREKMIEAWNIIRKIHPNTRIIQIVQVEEYYCLVLTGLANTRDIECF
jgi:hypothetical protein